MNVGDITIMGDDVETVTMTNKKTPYLAYGTLKEVPDYGAGWWLFWWTGTMRQVNRHFIGGVRDDPCHALEEAPPPPEYDQLASTRSARFDARCG